MTQWASADLLSKCKLYARRPTTDQAMPDTAWYSFLSDAQAEVYSDLFSRSPEMAYSAPVLMTTADGGKTYTFGTDAEGDPIYPMGAAEIYPSLQSIPDDPLLPGVDFMVEGSKIRMDANRTRTFSSGPYIRFVARPDVAISAASQPLLFPKQHRILLVWKALESWASRPGSGADPSYWAAKYSQALNRIYVDLATSFNQQGDPSGLANGRWWKIGDLAQAGSLNV